jgi:KAP family P-loop domain
MDIPGFIFVLALDYDVLVRAVSYKYSHVSGHILIEKMVQVPFRVPRLDLDPDTFARELIPDWFGRQARLPRSFSAMQST